MRKKHFTFALTAALLTVVLAVCLLAVTACGKNDTSNDASNGESFPFFRTSETTQQPEETEPAMTEAPQEATQAATQEATAAPTATTRPTASPAATSTPKPTPGPTIEPEEPRDPFVGATAAPTVYPEDIQTTTSSTKLKQIGTASFDGFKYAYVEGAGIVYKDANNKYGVISFDGKKNTGAIYASITAKSEYFVVSTEDVNEDYNRPATLNHYGLIDGTGRVIVPEEYALISIRGDFAVAIKATQRVYNKDQCMFYVSSGFMAGWFGPSDNSPMFRGKWDVYNIPGGRQIAGISGRKNSRFDSYGDMLRYKDDDGKYHYIDIKGKEYTEFGSQLLSNGTYLEVGASEAYVCNYDGTHKFKYDPNEFTVDYYNGQYYAVKKENGNNKYALLNEKGKVVSQYYSGSERPVGYGDLVFDGNALYKADGTKLTDCTEIGFYDSDMNRAVVAKINAEYYFYYPDGRQYLAIKKSDADVRIENGRVYISKGDSSNKSYYCFKDKDYTFGAIGTLSNWMAKRQNSGGRYELVDYFTGQTLLQGYDDFHVYSNHNGGIYILAIIGDKIEIYQVV